MGTAQLLVVDDNPDNLDVLTVILRERFRVLSYAGAPEALNALKTHTIDLVLLDIAMGPPDGIECLRAIRGLPGYESLPAIALTAHAREVDREAFVAAGFQAVVTKPILEFGDLFEAIARLLQRSPGSESGPGMDGHAGVIPNESMA